MKKKDKIKEVRLIDNVTVENLDIALRMCKVEINTTLIDLIIDLVELIEDKGDGVNIRDIIMVKNNHELKITKIY